MDDDSRNELLIIGTLFLGATRTLDFYLLEMATAPFGKVAYLDEKFDRRQPI